MADCFWPGSLYASGQFVLPELRPSNRSAAIFIKVKHAKVMLVAIERLSDLEMMESMPSGRFDYSGIIRLTPLHKLEEEGSVTLGVGRWEWRGRRRSGRCSQLAARPC
jgi:hypothetical protein